MGNLFSKSYSPTAAAASTGEQSKGAETVAPPAGDGNPPADTAAAVEHEPELATAAVETPSASPGQVQHQQPPEDKSPEPVEKETTVVPATVSTTSTEPEAFETVHASHAVAAEDEHQHQQPEEQEQPKHHDDGHEVKAVDEAAAEPAPKPADPIVHVEVTHESEEKPTAEPEVATAAEHCQSEPPPPPVGDDVGALEAKMEELAIPADVDDVPAVNDNPDVPDQSADLVPTSNAD